MSERKWERVDASRIEALDGWRHAHAEMTAARDAMSAALADSQAEVERLREAWKKDNTCGICPYRQAIQAEVERLREDFRTLYAHTKNIEGLGPIRYIEALDICRRNGGIDG